MWHQPETERKNQGWKSCSHVKMGISRGENGAPSRISTRRHTHRHRDRGVARHPSRIGEISVSARNPPLLFPRVPLAGFCSSCSSSSCAALPPLFTPRNPRRACHVRCIVVLSGAISLSVSQGHRNPWCALTCPPTSRTSRRSVYTYRDTRLDCLISRIWSTLRAERPFCSFACTRNRREPWRRLHFFFSPSFHPFFYGRLFPCFVDDRAGWCSSLSISFYFALLYSASFSSFFLSSSSYLCLLWQTLPLLLEGCGFSFKWNRWRIIVRRRITADLYFYIIYKNI